MAKLQKRTDMHVSTLRRVVEAVGVVLELSPPASQAGTCQSGILPIRGKRIRLAAKLGSPSRYPYPSCPWFGVALLVARATRKAAAITLLGARMSVKKFATIAICAVSGAFPIFAAKAQTLTTVYNFAGGTDGASPQGGLTYHSGILYGTTASGGASGGGTVYSVDPATGAEAVLYSLAAKAGTLPLSTLTYHSGTLYGTAFTGGKSDAGTVFKVKIKSGKGGTVHDFQGGADGAYPAAGLVSLGGKLYGTTSGVDAVMAKCKPSKQQPGCGTVFELDPSANAESVLYTFTGSIDGSVPNALVAQGGMLYGTTQGGGAKGYGTIFMVDPSTGAETVLHSFEGGSDGELPAAGLIYDSGFLYGTTYRGTFTRHGVAHCICGTVFKFDIATGTNTVVGNFDNRPSHGRAPVAPVLLLHGTLYGTTSAGGENGFGTVFKAKAATGPAHLMHSFSNGADGAGPAAGLTYVKGAFYGTTSAGGAYGHGTVFKLVP